jgi:hypothetical protein
VYFERTHFFCPNKLYLYAVFFLSGSETGCKGNGDVLHATSFAFGISHLLAGSYEDKLGQLNQLVEAVIVAILVALSRH